MKVNLRAQKRAPSCHRWPQTDDATSSCQAQLPCNSSVIPRGTSAEHTCLYAARSSPWPTERQPKKAPLSQPTNDQLRPATLCRACVVSGNSAPRPQNAPGDSDRGGIRARGGNPAQSSPRVRKTRKVSVSPVRREWRANDIPSVSRQISVGVHPPTACATQPPTLQPAQCAQLAQPVLPQAWTASHSRCHDRNPRSEPDECLFLPSYYHGAEYRCDCWVCWLLASGVWELRPAWLRPGRVSWTPLFWRRARRRGGRVGGLSKRHKYDSEPLLSLPLFS